MGAQQWKETKYAGWPENQQNDMCAQLRLRSAVYLYSLISLHCVLDGRPMTQGFFILTVRLWSDCAEAQADPSHFNL